jgi:hypothetical protein
MKLMRNKLARAAWLVALVLSLAGCARAPVLSFRGGPVDPNLKTLSVETFYTEVAAGPANLGLRFSEELREYFMRNTSLALTRGNGDLLFAGAITRYEVTPVAPTAGTVDQGGAGGVGFSQLAGQQRLTIGVKVQFTNAKDDTKSFEQEFSFFQDFAQGRNLSEVEADLIRTIFDQLVLDIFNKTLGDW